MAKDRPQWFVCLVVVACTREPIVEDSGGATEGSTATTVASTTAPTTTDAVETTETTDLGGTTTDPASTTGAPPGTAPFTLTYAQVKRFELTFDWPTELADSYLLLERTAPDQPFTAVGDPFTADLDALALPVPLHLRRRAGYALRACDMFGCSDSAPVEVTAEIRDAIGYLKAGNTDPLDLFGFAVALSGDGETLAVAAIDEDGPGGDPELDGVAGAGAVYVFRRSGDVWSQTDYLKADIPNAGDNFGIQLALSADGGVLVVGASGEDSPATGVDGDQSLNTAENAGAVYVFVHVGDQWTRQAYLKASNTDAGDKFGAVALDAAGTTLIVGAREEGSAAPGIDGDQADDSLEWAGAAYVFTRVGDTWAQQAYLKASNPGELDFFGSTLALSADGDTLAIGAYGEDNQATGVDAPQDDVSAHFSGAVYMFTRTAGVWSQQAYLKASNADAGDKFGHGLALSADGNTLAVGAPGEGSTSADIDGDQTDNSGQDVGAVYVFTRAGGAWSQDAYLKTASTGWFGTSLAFDASGTLLAVGATVEHSLATGIDGDQTDTSGYYNGAAYVFRRGDAWSQVAYVKPPNTETSHGFGCQIALSADGHTLAIGADNEASKATGVGGDQADDSAPSAGAVYLY